MSSTYTTLKAIDSYNDIDILNQVQQSMIMFFDWGLLNIGAYSNIYVSQTDINSKDQSKLRKVSDPSYTDGRVWETFHHNLVWESGLATAGQPINISGVYINGVFRAPDASGYEHYVDYVRGRVIFNTAQTATSIKMEYSYKTVDIGRISDYPEIYMLQEDKFDFTNYDASASGQWAGLLRKQMPLVAVEVSPRISYRPVDLGTGTQFVYTDVLMHIFDNNDIVVNKLLSILSLQKEKTIYMPDINLIIASGAYPLDYRGAKTSDPKTFEQLVDGNYRGLKLYFDDATAQGSRLNKVYHGVVRFKTETIALL